MDFDTLYKEVIEVSGTRYDYHARIKQRMKYTWGNKAQAVAYSLGNTPGRYNCALAEVNGFVQAPVAE